MSHTTIRRRREAGELPGAVLDDDRGRLIPVEDPLAAGFRLNAPAPPDEKEVGDPAPTEVQQDTVDTDALRAELDRLRHEHALALADERTARQLAEAEARCRRTPPGAPGRTRRPASRTCGAPWRPLPRPRTVPPSRKPAPPFPAPVVPGADGGRGGHARLHHGETTPLVAAPGPA